MPRIIRAKYEDGVLKPLEKLELKEGEEVIVRVEKIGDRGKVIERFYGLLGSADKELLEEFMLEAESQ